jgi:hypothetical protein
MRMTKQLKEQMQYLLELAQGSADQYMWDDEIEDFDFDSVIQEMWNRLKL